MPIWDIGRHPATDQFAVWSEVICQAFVPLKPSRTAPAGPGFASRVETRELGAVNRARIESQPQLTAHGPREVARSSGEYVFVNLQVRGRCHVRHQVGDGVESVVTPGQLVVLDTTAPYHLRFDEPWQMVSFRVPHRSLGGPPRRPRLGHAVDGSAGTGLVVRSLMEALWQWDGDGPDRVDMERAFTSVVGAALGEPVDEPAVAGLRAAVLRHVAANLGDPDLSVASVARTFAVSPRTLHAAFAGQGATFAASVRAMRLERCARALADPTERSTVTAIAARYGYGDPTAFSRAFRRAYGVAPTDVRR